MINKKDMEELKKQIESWSIKPSTMLMNKATYRDLFGSEINRLYKCILQYGYKIATYHERGQGGMTIYLEHDQHPTTAIIIGDNDEEDSLDA